MTPQIPLLFMGEEWGCTTPFLFFVDHHDELADAVREGRRTEFAHFAAFSDPEKRDSIPDPNAPETFVQSIPKPHELMTAAETETLAFYEKTLHAALETYRAPASPARFPWAPKRLKRVCHSRIVENGRRRCPHGRRQFRHRAG